MIRLGLDEARWQEKRDLTYEQFSAAGLVGPPVTAGVAVSQYTANTVAAYWNGVSVISGDVGSLDRHLYRKIGEDFDRERADDHPVYGIIHDQPNPQTTGMQFWETLASHAVSWGNGYAEIERDNAGRPLALWLITPDQIEPKVEVVVDKRGRRAMRVFYLYCGQRRLEADEVLHVPGRGFDGVQGYSPVALFRQSLGLAMASERFAGALFGNGAWPGIALQHPKALKPESVERLRQSFEQLHRGPDQAHRTLILEEGMTVSKPITIPPNDAQFLESRAFDIEQIARILNLPPHKLKHKTGERPGGNIEAQEIDYEVTTLIPWTTRIEQECDRKLLSNGERGTYYVEHNFVKRLKLDTTTRMAAYEALFKMNVIDNKEIARRENLPVPTSPAVPALPRPAAPPEPVDAVPDSSAPPAPARTGQMAAAQRTLLVATAARYLRRESENARRAAKKGGAAFGQWVESFYSLDEEALLTESLEPAVGVYLAYTGAEGDAREIARACASGYLARSKAELGDLGHKDVAAAVPLVLKRWETTRAVEAADEMIAALTAAEGPVVSHDQETIGGNAA